MGLLRTILTPNGRRPLGWVVATSDYGNVLVVRKTPHAIAVSTRRRDYVSINESAAQDQAGWPLDDALVRAIKSHAVQHVAVFVPKPGMLYMTDASNYFKGGVVYTVPKNKSGARWRCVGLEHFDKRPYRVKI